MKLLSAFKQKFVSQINRLKINYFLAYLLISLVSCYLAKKSVLFLALGFVIISLLTLFHWKQRWLIYCLNSFLLLSFLTSTLLGFLSVPKEVVNLEVQVIEIKKSYLIVRHQWNKFYINLFDLKTDQQIVLNQYLKLTGLVKEIFFQSKTYEFAFDEYLAAKNIHYQIEIKDFTLLTKGIMYQISQFYALIFKHDLVKIFFLTNRDSEFGLVSSLKTIELSYLLNFSGLVIFFGSWIFNKLLTFLKIKFKWKIRIKLVFDLILFSFSATLNFPFIFTKTVLFLLIKNFFWLKRIKINRYSLWAICFTILIAFNQHLIRSASFLYYLVGLLFFSPSFLKGWKKFFLNFIIASISFGLVTSFLTYRFYYFNEVFSLLFAPFIGLLNIFIWFTWFIPNISLVYDFLEKLLIQEFDFLKSFNLFYSFGYIPLFWYLLTLGFFLLSIKITTTQFKSWWTILVFLIGLTFLFTYRIWFSVPGLHILDIGNGTTSVYINSNQVIVFDAGVGVGHSKQTLTRFLEYLGIDQINYLFISHAHQDHYNEVENLSNNGIWIKHLVHKEIALNLYQFKNFELRVFNLNQHQTNENDNSLVILLITKNYNVLLMGDLEKFGENQLLTDESFCQTINAYKVDYLLVGHHGSKTSSTLAFLKFVSPKMALISGEHHGLNNFPNLEVIERLNLLKIPFLLTSRDGDLWIK